MQLDERSLGVLKEIVFQPHMTIAQLEQKLDLSRRQIQYDLRKIDAWLESQALPPLKYRRHAGFDIPQGLKEKLSRIPQDQRKKQYVWSADERLRLLLLMILGQDGFWSLAHAQSLLRVSRNTALADLKEAKSLAAKSGVCLEYSRDKGYHLTGTEWDIRSLLHRLIAQTLERRNGEELLQEALTHLEAPSFHSMIAQLESIERRLQIRYTDERFSLLTYLFLWMGMRIRQGMRLQWEERDLMEIMGTPEFEAGGSILQSLKESAKFKGLCQEQAYIALMLLATNVSRQEKSVWMQDVAIQMIHRFETVACVNLGEKERFSEMLAMHLTPAYYRIKYGLELKNPLTQSIRKQHAELHHLVKKCVAPFADRIGKAVSEDEIAYLTIHFGGWLRRQGVELVDRPRAVVVCPKGIAVSNLLIRTLRELFPDLLFLDAMTIREYFAEEIPHDLVFSTVHLRTDKKMFVVKPILGEEEKARLRYEVSTAVYGMARPGSNLDHLLQVIGQFADIHDWKGLAQALSSYMASVQSPIPLKKKDEKPVLNELITRDTVLLRKRATSWEEAIRLAAQPLLHSGAIEERYVDAMVASIQELGPYVVITPHVAIPHARPEQGVNQLAMSFCQLAEPVSFPQNKPVRLLFVLAAVDNESHLKALAQLSELLAREEEIRALMDAETVDAVLELMDRYSKGETEQ